MVNEIGTFGERKKGLKSAITVTRRTRRRGVIEGLVEMPIQGSSCNVSNKKESQNPYEQFEDPLLSPIHVLIFV